jgi:pimeloyl-ACP methyl ester carboxylesterase
MDERHTLQAAERFGKFDRPALIAWSREDRFFPRRHAERLAEALPNARLAWIDDAYTLVSEDQPERLAELIAAFIREPAARAPATPGR